MQVKAKARFIRMSARKVRLVIDLIRGARVAQAQTQLRFANKVAAEPVLKLLNSAIANATNNFQLNKDDLVITSIMADEGPTLDRFHPRAHGRAMHISIVLENIEPKAEKVEKVVAKKPKTKTVKKSVTVKTT